MRLLKTAIICASFLGSTQALAVETIDVDNLMAGFPFSGFYSGQPVASFPKVTLYQTFTVQQSGVFGSLTLTSGAGGSGNGDVYVELFRGGSLTVVGDTSLAMITRAASDIANPANHIFDFSSFSIDVSAGEVLTFKLWADDCSSPKGCTTFNAYNNSGSTNTNGYAGGSVFVQNQAAPVVSLTDDLSFRTSVLVSGAVPEPATWAMMIAGFGLVGASMRKKARAQATATA